MSSKCPQELKAYSNEQELWHQLCFSKPPEVENLAVSWPLGQALLNGAEKR